MTRIASRFALSLSLLGAVAALAEDWPNFRGPRHDGISLETGLKADWSAAPPKVWEQKIGSGFSGLSIVGDRLFTCGTHDAKQTVVCMKAGSGEVLWQTPIEGSYFEGQGGSGPRATPTVDSGRVYVLGALGKLVCLNAADGKLVWEKQFDGKPTWGFSGSVLIDGDKAIVSAGGKFGGLVAYDKASGTELWKAGDDAVSYATPYPFDFAGTRYVVGFLAKSAIIVQAADGKIAATMKWNTDYDVNAAAPLFHNGHLLLGSGYDTGSAVFKLSKDGEKLKLDNVWGGIQRVLLMKFQSAVLHDGHLYCSDQSKLKCVEFLTGKEKWSEPRIKDSTLVLAEGRLFVQGEKGKLLIAPADPAGFKPSTKIDLVDGLCWTVPTLSGGRLYTRNLDTVYCFNLK
jgi:outer membrane protein assembly factor BamB